MSDVQASNAPETIGSLDTSKWVWPNKHTAWDFREKAQEMFDLLKSDAPIDVKYFRMGVFVQQCDEFASRLADALPSREGEYYS